MKTGYWAATRCIRVGSRSSSGAIATIPALPSGQSRTRSGWFKQTPAGRQVAASVQDTFKRLDPTRPVTYPAPVGNEFTGINEIIEARGWNYHVGKDMDDYHAAHPRQPNLGSEQGSTVSTRGIYANDKQRGYVSAYDDNTTSWSNTRRGGGASSTRARGCRAASSGPASTIAESRPPTTGLA